VRIQGDGALPVDLEPALLRVTQEALSNVVRHSEAGKVKVQFSQDEDDLRLTIVDDGRGFDVAAAKNRGYGLQSMQERVEALGGQLLIKSEPGQGARISAHFKVIDRSLLFRQTSFDG